LAKAKRVFELAKELGVKSKAIVEKCKAEGVGDVTNHMSTVKLGLEMTIREWFAASDEESEHHAVETSERVDLDKVRAPKRARRKAKAASSASDTDDDGGGTATATLEPPADTADTAADDDEAAEAAAPDEPEEPDEQDAADDTDAAAPAAEPETQAAAEPAEAPAADETADEAAADEQPAEKKPKAAAKKKSDESVAPVGEQNVPSRPDVVKPVGEQVQPEKAQLRGPKVVRVEKAEPDPLRQPRQGPSREGGGYDPNVPGITRSRGPARGGGVRGAPGEPEPMPGRGPGGPGGPGGRGGGGKRRSVSTRRGRSADALPTGPAKFSQADMEELDARLKGSAGFVRSRRRDLRNKRGGVGPAATPVQTGGKVEVEEPITIKSLSAATGIKAADIIKYLFMQKKLMATVNSAIGTEAAMEVALEYDIELDVKEQQTAEEQVEQQFQQREAVDVRPRPPVVTVMGHVDHGKTSLLDRIRKADVAHHEAGGITQHVGAYRVTVEGGDGEEKTVVFLDTPGHEAFTSMRGRGASVTDLVVLVVAADDGVMPQTIESINHAKAAGVPLIVALNKSDLPNATEENVQKIYGQLAEHGLNPTGWGGETEVIKTSAQTGDGVQDLLEILDYQAQLLELTADFGGPARGTVIEAEMQPGRGSVARVLVQDGQIKVGDFIVSGRAFGRVRDMTDERKRSIKQAGPATPLELSGINEIPDAGDKFFVTDTLKRAEEVATQYRETERQQMLASSTKVTLDNFADAVAAGQVRELRVVLKADVQGSMDVLRQSLEKIGNNEVAVKVIHAAVGGVTESDVVLADVSDAIVVGFHVGVPTAVREIADERDVDIRLHRVIYDVTDEVKKALEGMLDPETNVVQLGEAEVKETFKVSKVGTVAGLLVTDGAMRNDVKIRVERDGVVVTDNRKVASLKRVKDEVKEVQVGTECGLKIDGFDDVKIGDRLIAYRVEKVKRTLD